MMRYTHFVFDIDNTLINTTGAVLHGLQRALRDVTGEHWDLSRLTPVLGIPGLDAFERLGIHSPEQIFQIYPRWEQYEQEYQYTAYLYEGIVPLLDSLKKGLRSWASSLPRQCPSTPAASFLFRYPNIFRPS
ncbi:MAG: HAD family hydrolase [Enterocloster bolteae]